MVESESTPSAAIICASVATHLRGMAAHHIINSDLLELVPDVLLEEVVRSPCIDVHVSTHGHQLRPRQVVQRDIVVEQLRNTDDVGVRWSLSGGSNLDVSKVIFPSCTERTFRKNSLNSSLLTTLSALRPSSFTVSCKNLAISIRTRRSFRCFSS